MHTDKPCQFRSHVYFPSTHSANLAREAWKPHRSRLELATPPTHLQARAFTNVSFGRCIRLHPSNHHPSIRACTTAFRSGTARRHSRHAHTSTKLSRSLVIVTTQPRRPLHCHAASQPAHTNVARRENERRTNTTNVRSNVRSFVGTNDRWLFVGSLIRSFVCSFGLSFVPSFAVRSRRHVEDAQPFGSVLCRQTVSLVSLVSLVLVLQCEWRCLRVV